ncbi:MAG: hypothetical protein H3C34_11520 [Caldilineaceae bacterium]|nr:hypothetical protein [Caldilineaceae bacterium]
MVVDDGAAHHRPWRRPAFDRFLVEGRVKPGYAADNGVAFHFIDGKLYKIVASRPAARGYQLALCDGQSVETPLATEYLTRA